MKTLGRIAAPADAADGRHAGIVPAVDHALVGENQEVALRHEGVVEVQFVELKLAGTVVLNVAPVAAPLLDPRDEEVVELVVGHKLQSADGVGDTFEIVALSVGEVVHGIGVPLVARAPVGHVEHAIHDGVAEVHVGRSHVDLGAQNHLAGSHVAGVHLTEEAQALLGGTVAIGRILSGLRRGAFLGGNLLGGLLVDIGTALQDAPFGKVPKILEIVGSIDLLAPFEAEPLDVLLDGADILHVFLLGIGVVHAQVAGAAELAGGAEIHGDGFGVTDMQIAVGLGREACLQSAAVESVGQILFYPLFYEIKTFFCVLHIQCSINLIVFARKSTKKK